MLPIGEHFKKHPKLAKPSVLRLGNFLRSTLRLDIKPPKKHFLKLHKPMPHNSVDPQ
jgi:hypothetical protein